MSEFMGESPVSEPVSSGGSQESAQETIQRVEIRIPRLIREDIKPYIDDLTFDEWKKNEDARFLQHADAGRARLGQLPIDPAATKRLAGRPKEDPYAGYKHVQDKYKKALSDSERDIRQDSRRSFKGLNAFGERAKINPDKAEERRLDIEVDVTDLLGFINNRITHKDSNLRKAFDEMAEQQAIAGRSSGNEERRAELKAHEAEKRIVKEAKEKEKLQLWYDLLDRQSQGEITEIQANKDYKKAKKALEKRYEKENKRIEKKFKSKINRR